MRLGDWTRMSTESSGTDTAVLIAANKCDLGDVQVTDDEMNSWASANGFPLVKTSAKTGSGIRELFRLVGESIHRLASFSRGVPQQPRDRVGTCC
jgi:50S ribosomal subunit-associated GTPase HflX